MIAEKSINGEWMLKVAGKNRVPDTSGAGLLSMARPEILKAARYYTHLGYIEPLFAEDMIQDVLLHVYEHREKIMRQFMVQSAFKTYLYSIIRNRFMTLTTSKKYKMHERDLTMTRIPASDYAHLHVYLKGEFRRLEALLAPNSYKSGKLLICLKAVCRIRIQRAELYECIPGMDSRDADRILEINWSSNTSLTDRDIYAVLAAVFTRYEKKPVRSDSLRKWTDNRMEFLREQMSSNDQDTRYTTETLQLLMEYYFASIPRSCEAIHSCA